MWVNDGASVDILVRVALAHQILASNVPRLVESQIHKDETDTHPEKLSKLPTIKERFSQSNLQHGERYDSPSFSKMLFEKPERKEGSETRLIRDPNEEQRDTDFDHANASKISAFGPSSRQKPQDKPSQTSSALRRLGSTDKAGQDFKTMTESFVDAFKSLNKKTQQDISRLLQTLMIERAASSPARNTELSKLGSVRNNYL